MMLYQQQYHGKCDIDWQGLATTQALTLGKLRCWYDYESYLYLPIG